MKSQLTFLDSPDIDPETMTLIFEIGFVDPGSSPGIQLIIVIGKALD